MVIGFTNGDPSRPFVTGAIFPETKSAGGGDSNKQKSLTTRSGVAMTLDDSCGSATLKDPSGNSVHQDGAGNITITAPNSFTVNCGSSTLVMKEDGTISINGKNITLDMSEQIEFKIGETNTTTMSTEETKMEPQTKLLIKTKTVTATGSEKAIVGNGKGDYVRILDTLDIKNSSDININGSKVNIN